MGRPRKPTAVRQLEAGRADRVNAADPSPPPGRPERPAYLDAPGRAAWDRVVAHLEGMRVVTPADAEALGLYARAHSRWLQAEALVAREGLVIETESTKKAHPAIAISAECHRQMVRILCQFGMTPAARAGLQVQGPAGVDELAEFLGGGAKGGAGGDS